MRRIFLLVCCLTLAAFSLYARPQRDVSGALRVGIIPSAEGLPIIVANDRGYFAEEGVDFELTFFPNPAERDAAIQAGQIDGIITDMFGAAFFVAAGFNYRIVSVTNGRHGIVAAPQSGIANLEDLRGRRVGLFPNTLTHFLVDTMLSEVGISGAEWEVVAVPNLMIRLESVLTGMIDAALLPEAMLTAAVAQGAILVADTENTDLSAASLFFSQRVIDTRLDDMRAFYRAYNRAIRAINANPDAFRDTLVDRANFPPAVRDTFQFFTFNEAELPTEQQLNRSLDWLRGMNLLTTDLSPSDLVDSRVLN